jgi:hypothetical protein
MIQTLRYQVNKVVVFVGRKGITRIPADAHRIPAAGKCSQGITPLASRQSPGRLPVASSSTQPRQARRIVVVAERCELRPAGRTVHQDAVADGDAAEPVHHG